MRVRRRKNKKPPGLMLTSLLDMFTIILVFLLESFQAEDEDFTLHAGLTLPESTARSAFKPAVNVAVSTEAILVEGVEVHPLADGAATPGELEAGFVVEIAEAVEASWEQRKLTVEDDVIITSIQADEAIPYETVDLVMRSAAHVGCTRFRLVIEKGD